MNISSVIIYLKDNSVKNGVLKKIKHINECEIITHENVKIVAVITADDVDSEIRIFRSIEAIDGVSAVAMVYTYQEDVGFDKDKLETKNNISEILTNENIKAENIAYNGSVGYKIK